MAKYIDLLERVQAELKHRDGELRAVADGSGIHYDTLRRIRDGIHDPGYSKVRVLGEFFCFVPSARHRTA
jgi:hypothetical protein